MKKIINGKRYDTETATQIAKHNNGLFTNDFYHVTETLYKTAKGAYFLHGEGGAASKYAESNRNASWGSQDIIPMTPEQAQEWLEEHDFADEIEQEFPESIQDA